MALSINSIGNEMCGQNPFFRFCVVVYFKKYFEFTGKTGHRISIAILSEFRVSFAFLM